MSIETIMSKGTTMKQLCQKKLLRNNHVNRNDYETIMSVETTMEQSYQ